MFYELSLFMTYMGQRCLNVFNVFTADEPAVITGAFGAAQAFGFVPDEVGFPTGTFFEQLRGCLSSNVIFNQVRVKNPYSVTDFYSQPFPSGTDGDISGESLSPLEGLSVFSNQTRLDIQAGQKRFVGVPESSVENGGVLTTAALASLQDLADIMSAPMTYVDEGNTLSYRIVVAKKQTYTTPSGKEAARYYTTETLQEDNMATGLLWSPRAHTSSQTTRQYGRGR